MNPWEQMILQQRMAQEGARAFGQQIKTPWDIAPFSSAAMNEYEAGLPYEPSPDIGVGVARGLAASASPKELDPSGSGSQKEASAIGGMDPATKAKIEKYLRQMEGDIGAQGQLAAAYAGKPAQLDLSPLAALSDSLSRGGKLLQGYKRPEGIEEDLKAQSAFRELQRKGRGEIVDALNKQLFNKGYLDQLRMEATQKRFEQKRADLSDKQVEEVNNFDTAAQEAATLMEDLKPGFTGTGAGLKSVPIIKNFSDPNAVAFQARVGRLTDVYRKLVTGAAAADQELKRIESRLPQVNDPPGVFQKKASDYIEQINRAKERYLKNLSKKGKDISEFSMEAAKAPSSGLSSKDKQALDWANKNPSDPRAAAIKQKLGM